MYGIVKVEKALLQIEAEEKAGIIRYTPVEKVFSELDRIVDEVIIMKSEML